MSRKFLVLVLVLFLSFGLAAGYYSSTDTGGDTNGPGGDDGGDDDEERYGDEEITVDFSYSPAEPDPGEQVDFTDESSSTAGSINSWDWEFGNGDSSTDENPSTTYDSAGSYLVSLTVTDTAGNQATREKTLNAGNDFTSNSCSNGADDDDDGLADNSDPGCVQPNYNDLTEGMIYDSLMTATMEGFTTSSNSRQSYTIDPGETEALKFSGYVSLGGGNQRWDDSGALTNHYVDAARSEADDNYGLGFHEEQTFSSGDFATYDGQEVEFTSGRIVDPPHTYSEVCGNGLEEEDYSGPEGDEKNTNPESIDCKKDIGRILEKHYINEPYQRDGMECEKDKASCETTEKTCTCTSSSCGGSSCSDGSCSATVTVECTVDEDNSDDESNTYYLTDGDKITTRSCEDNGGWIAEKEDSTSCSTGSCSTSWTYSCGPSNEQSCNASCSGSGDDAQDSDSDEAGRYREWKEVDSYNCDEQHSQTDGGGITNNARGDNDPAGTYTRFTAFNDDSWGTTNQDGGEDGTVWCGYDYALTVDADGPNGNGDGFIVIDQRSASGTNAVVARESPDGSDNVGRNVHHGTDGDATNVGTDYIGTADLSCNGAEVCIKYVDFYTEPGGSAGSPTWQSISEAVRSRVVFEATPDESYSVCKTINRINQENGDSRGADLIDCDYMRGGDNASPLPEACGDEANEHLLMMEGPEVSQGTVENYLAHEQKCVSWSDDTGYFDRDLNSNACILKGKAVSEGTVANVVSGTNEIETVDGYERPEDSPDYEVCLNMRGGSPSTSYEDKAYNYRYDDTSNGEDEIYGGQWYDLDDPRVNEYLRNNEGSLSLTADQKVGDPNYINYYYTENPNPNHPDYNPEGGNRGTSLLADCGPLLPSCTEDPNARQSINAEDGTVFAFFDEYTGGGRTRDEDYNPLGRNYPTSVEPIFDPMGKLNFIKSRSDQLSPGHYDYDTTYSPVEWYRSTEATVDEAVQYAYTRNMEWSIASTGVPYPQFDADQGAPYVDGTLGNYYREDYTGSTRNSADDDTVQKTAKAFGNSLAVVAQQSGITDSKGDTISVGEGYWIDPDDIRDEYTSGNIQGMDGVSTWRDLLTFKVDLTGPDSGIGYDLEDGSMSSSDEGYVDEIRSGGDVVFADIYWQGLEDGSIDEKLETSVCGDDRYEFLLEEMGESANSERFEGRYACADSPDYCVSYENGSERLYPEGGSGSGFSYINANEKREDVGRLKLDREACAQRPVDTFPMWYDQDYGRVNGELTCRENNLYGEIGVRWMPYDYINQHPHAVTGGIDDSWSDRYTQLGHPFITSDSDSFPDDPLDNGVTPVDTGTNSSRVADPTTMDYGFCAGDDSSEYLVYQKSETRFVETDNDILGAAASPRSCVLENSQLDNSGEERRLYEEGDRVQFEVGDGSNQEIACYDGAWWGDWPVVFLEDEVTATLGETRYSSFRIINPEETSRTFDLQLSFSDSNLDQMTTFASSSSNTMNVSIPGGESRTYDVEIVANRELSSENVELIAETRRGDLQGSDDLQVSITEGGNIGSSSGQTREVPGITVIQMIVASLIASALIFFRS